MTPAERVALAIQIIESELQYWEIKKRVDVLQANASRTPAQDFELSDYQAKLAHDRAVILGWGNAIKADGVVNPLSLINRATVLTAIRTRLQTQIDNANDHITKLQSLPATISPGQSAQATDAMARRQDEITKLTTLQTLVDDLTSSGTLAWQR